MRKSRVVLVGVALVLGGCSTMMEANRPAAVNLNGFAPGSKRMDVVAQLGSPTSTEADGDRYCDVYSLYTRSVNRAQKGVIMVGEATADILTGGLFEAFATPAEVATKAKKDTVLFCYSNDGSLQSVIDEGKPVKRVQTKLPAEAAKEEAKAASQ
jgi:outer membrane protein assembly factor BamE (lipoprotein component of BamABCDE complex)